MQVAHAHNSQTGGGWFYIAVILPPPPPPPQPEPACTLPAEPMFLVQTGIFCIEIIVDISYKRFIFHSEALAFASPGE